MVQQQALRDFSQAMASFFVGPRRPTWRKAGRDEGFRIVAVKSGHVRRLSRKTGRSGFPKPAGYGSAGPALSPRLKSYRVTLDRAGRWHIAFAAIPNLYRRQARAVWSASTGVSLSPQRYLRGRC